MSIIHQTVSNQNEVPADISAAFIGPAGRFANLFRSVFHPSPVLLHFLGFFSVYAGRDAHTHFCGQEVRPNLFVAGVGDGNPYLRPLYQWFSIGFPEQVRIVSGTNSNKVVFEFRDPLYRPEKGGMGSGDFPWFAVARVDEGVADKRSFLVQPALLNSLTRNIVSAASMRSLLTRAFVGDEVDCWINFPAGGILRCSGPHLSVITTVQRLTRVRAIEEVLNLFVFFALEPIEPFFSGVDFDTCDLANVIAEYANDVPCKKQRLDITSGAATVFLDTAVKMGVQRNLILMQQLVKLGLNYALLDHASAIDEVHARAASALFRYSSFVRRKNGFGFQDDPVRMKLISILRAASEVGLTTTDVKNKMSNVASSTEVQIILDDLVKQQKVGCDVIRTGGRPVRLWLWAGDDESPY